MKIKFSIYLVSIVILFFFITELSFRLYFNETNKLSCYEKVKDKRNYVNKKNCYFEEKYFEKKSATIYLTNNLGYRVGNILNNEDLSSLAFVGDSFTYGYLSNYENTFPFNLVKEINKIEKFKNYKEINLGVNGYQFEQVLELLKLDIPPIEKSDYIIYGLTPNDLFDIVEKKNNKIKFNKGYLDKLRSGIYDLNLTSVKFFSTLLLKSDKNYINIYHNRGNDSGYLNEMGSESWDYRYSYFKEKIASLSNRLKDKLIIVIIPQQIQVRLLKIGNEKDALSFDNKIKKICDQINIACVSITKEFAEINNYITHYTLDGHLLPEANKSYGKLLTKKFFKIINE